MCKVYLDHIHPQLLPETSPRLLLNTPPSTISIIFFLKKNHTESSLCCLYVHGCGIIHLGVGYLLVTAHLKVR